MSDAFDIIAADERAARLLTVQSEKDDFRDPDAGTEVDDLTLMVAWEEDRLSAEGVINLFQRLVDSGVVWLLQGAYGRQAAAMLDAGLISAPIHIEGN